MRYRIVPERSTVLIEGSSSVHPITTRTDGLEGFLDLAFDGAGAVDVGSVAAGELSFAVARLRSGNPLEDRELQRRIDSRRYPTIDGRTTAIEATDVPFRYVVHGDLTFRGVTRACTDDVAIEVDGDVVHLTGRSTFDVRDFGMEPPRILLLRVHPDVTVTIDVVAEREG